MMTIGEGRRVPTATTSFNDDDDEAMFAVCSTLVS